MRSYRRGEANVCDFVGAALWKCTAELRQIVYTEEHITVDFVRNVV